MGKINQTDIDFASKSFNQLDLNGDHVLDVEDVVELLDPATRTIDLALLR